MLVKPRSGRATWLLSLQNPSTSFLKAALITYMAGKKRKKKNKSLPGGRWCTLLNSSTQGGRQRWVSVSSRSAWSTNGVPGQPELLHRESLS